MPVFLKQYGAQRTGTNYLRTLLQANYAGACTLMHILGDKHSPPAPFEALWAQALRTPDPPLTFAEQATFLRPSLTTSYRDPRQHQELRRIAAPLAEAYANGSLGFLISIKNPYAWAVSVAVFEQQIAPDAVLVAPTYVARACRSFNQRYAIWLELARRHASRSHIVRHEDLLSDPAGALHAIAGRFGLQRTSAAFVDEAGATEPVLWDHDPSTTKGVAFDRSYYDQERYLERLSPQALRAVTDHTDWELMHTFGYSPVT